MLDAVDETRRQLVGFARGHNVGALLEKLAPHDRYFATREVST